MHNGDTLLDQNQYDGNRVIQDSGYSVRTGGPERDPVTRGRWREGMHAADQPAAIFMWAR